MTDTQALRDLLVKVEAGEYERDGLRPPKVNALTNAFEAAGVKTPILAVAVMLKAGTISDHIRAMIAQATP